jgi:SAM-dependent methyltransferase
MKHPQNPSTDPPQDGPRSLVTRHPPDGQVTRDLASLHRISAVAKVHFTSHRKMLGPVVILLKQGLRKLLAPLLDRQAGYNAANTRLLFDVYRQIDVLRRRIDTLQTPRTNPTGQIAESGRVMTQRGIDAPEPSGPGPTQYETGWDTYVERWESSVQKKGLRHVGDEWGSRDLVETIIDHYVKPYLHRESIVLEIGCGGGKFSERLSSLCKLLICSDVSEQMLERTRLRSHGLAHIRFEKLNGLDLHQFAAESIDFIFSFDVFVHVEIEDIYGYLQEIRRVLTPGGIGLLHFANLNSEEGWSKFITEVPLNRGNHKNFDRFCFLTWDIVERFCHSLDFKILAHKREPWRDILVVISKMNGVSSTT